jgi:hypothetical protein
LTDWRADTRSARKHGILEAAGLSTISTMDRFRKSAIPRTSQITCSAGSRRRRSVAVPVAASACSIHSRGRCATTAARLSGLGLSAIASIEAVSCMLISSVEIAAS